MRSQPNVDADGSAKLRRMPWWTSPAGINFGFLLPVLLLIASAGDSSYPGLTIRGIRFLSPYYIMLGCLVLVVTGLSGWIGSYIALGNQRAANAPSVDYWDRAALFVGGVAIAAYVIWFRDFVFNPMLLWRTLSGSYHPDRTNISLTTGITSFSNVAPVFFSIYTYKTLVLRVKVSRTMHVMCAILVPFTIFRVYAWGERLALIEGVIPTGLALAAGLARARSQAARVISKFGPVIAIPALILYFAGAEYLRSWQYAEYNKRYSFWEFAIGRLISYYYTSLNNGAGVLATAPWPTMKFENILNWLHKAPFVGPYFSRAVDLQYAQMDSFLIRFGDPEFNNPSGVYSVFYDAGLTLGTLYFSLVGLAGGMLFRAYRNGQLAGVVSYPMFFITFLEVYRFPYLGMSRAFVWTLGIILALVVVNLGYRRRPDGAKRDTPVFRGSRALG